MKKSTLIIISVVLCISLRAQQAQPTLVVMPINNASALENFSSESHEKIYSDQWGVLEEITPTLRNSILLPSDGVNHLIGQTYYNSVTNGSARNTVSFRENSNHAAAVWTMGTPASSGASRGTGINYFNGTNWGTQPNPATGRIETEKTGWGGHAFTEQGEVVVSHNGTTGMVVNTRDNYGTGTWSQNILVGPSYTNGGNPTTAILWPSVFAVGNTVHMMCVTDAPTVGISYNESDFPNTTKWGYKGYTTYPLYYRSLNGGKNWEPPVNFGPVAAGGLGFMTPYETFKFGGDNYVVTAKGNHVVILFSTIYGMVYYLESLDAGVTWTRRTVYHIGEVFLTTYTQEVGPILLPRSGAVAIDEDDVVHVVFSTVLNKRTTSGINTYHLAPTGMVYWNSTMQQLNHENFTAEIIEGEFVFHYENYPGYIHLPSVVGFDQFYCFSNAPAYDYKQFSNNGWAAFPRLIVKEQKVYVSYQAPLDPPINFTVIGEDDVFCRGIFITVSDNNGASWDVQNNTSWISYAPNLLWIDWSNYTEDFWPVNDGGIITYYPGIIQAGIQVMTENAYPSMSYNTRENSIMLQWFNHFTSPFPNNGTVWENDPLYVYTTTQNLNNIPAFNNINYIYKSGTPPEPQLCEKPVGLSGSGNGSDAFLTWNAPVNMDGVLLGYNVYRDDVLIGTTPYSKREYLDMDLAFNTYYYQVSARYKHCAESEKTTKVPVVIKMPELCEKPDSLAGVANNNTAVLTWKKPKNIDGVLNGYNLYRDGDKINNELLTGLTYSDKDLDNATYLYKVSAVYKHCPESVFTDEVPVTIFVPQLCEKPDSLAAVADEKTAVLTWKKPENIDGVLLGYNLFRDGNPINSELLTDLTYSDKDLANANYFYKVSAKYEHCESQLTDSVSVTILFNAIHNYKTATFNIYPNPASNELQVTCYELQMNNIEIFDVYARRVLSHTPNLKPQTSNPSPRTTINVSHLQTGVYFVKISDNQQVVVKRLVIMK